MRNLSRFLYLAFAAVESLALVSTKTSCRRNTRLHAAAAAATTTADTCDVAIMGGGFGGLYSALAISRDAKRKGRSLDIVLVEPSESFVFLPLLYDLTVGTATEAEVCPSYKDLLEGTGVRQVMASLESFSSITTSTTSNSKSSNNLLTAVLKPSSPRAPTELTCRASVVAVGASPESILASVPGALEYAQPFYTGADAKKTRRLLAHLEDQVKQQQGRRPRVGVVGGGFGGVELAASVKRKIPSASVTLLSRGPPMAGTRAAPLIDKALQKLGVVVELCSVNAIEAAETHTNIEDAANPLNQQVVVKRSKWGEESVQLDTDPWDAVLWTAGSGPAYPVSNSLPELRKSESGRLAIDSSLRCFLCDEVLMTGGHSPEDVRTVKTVKFEQPPIWALGDCSEIVSVNDQPAVPKTAQAAMQQADVVAFNLLAQLESKGKIASAKSFQYFDLGSMLTLGGPNGALMAPREGAFAPLFAPLLDTAGGALGFADKMLEATVGRSPVFEKFGLSPETMGLSLGSYGLGVESGAAPGTLAGTLTGAARRAVYAARMPTNRQRAVAATSAAISTAAALAKEAASRNEDF